MKLKKLTAGLMALTVVSGLQLVSAENDFEVRSSLKIDGVEVDYDKFDDSSEYGFYTIYYKNIDSLYHTYEIEFDSDGYSYGYLSLSFPKITEREKYFCEMSWDAPFWFEGSNPYFYEDEDGERVSVMPLLISDYGDNIRGEAGAYSGMYYYIDSESGEESFKFSLLGSDYDGNGYGALSIDFGCKTSGTIKFTIRKIEESDTTVEEPEPEETSSSTEPEETPASSEEPEPEETSSSTKLEETPASSESTSQQTALPVTVTDSSTNISVSGALSNSAVLKTELKSQDKVSASYDITIVDQNGNIIQPTGTVTVKIPVPEALKGKNLKVFREETDGKYTNMNARAEDGYLVFETNHFSVYVVTAEKLDESGAESTTEAEGKPADPDKGSPDTGVVPVAAVGVAALAAGATAAIAIKKRK